MEKRKGRKFSLSMVFGMMTNPAGTIQTKLKNTSWFYSLFISGLAFALFFLQTGLDLFKTGQKPIDFVFLSTGIGLAYGILVIPILGGVLGIILKIFKSKKSLKDAVSSFCLSYTSALIYGILGLAFSLLLGWKTALAFGATGVLWATGPVIISMRELSGGKTGLSIILATLTSGIILFTWSLFGQI